MGRNLATLLVAVVCLLTGYALGFATGRSTSSAPAQVSELMPSEPPRTGRIKIESKPSGARVSVNGEAIRLSDGDHARTPIEALTQLQYGKQYVLRLEKKGYKPVSKTVVMNDLVDGETLELQLEQIEGGDPAEPSGGKEVPVPPTPPSPKQGEEEEVAVEAGMGLLSVSTTPPSIVHLDDDRLGVTPISRRKVAVGEHRLRLVFPSLSDHEELQVISVAEKRHLNLVRTMEIQREQATADKGSAAGSTKTRPGCKTIPGRVGEVMLTSDEIAEIHVGGARMGTTPLKLQLAAGCQMIEAISVNRGTRVEVKLDVKPGETTRHRLRF